MLTKREKSRDIILVIVREFQWIKFFLLTIDFKVKMEQELSPFYIKKAFFASMT